jgi:curved DNA-binding protein CbpA
MSKKKKRGKNPPLIKHEIPIQDDPYWKVSSIYMDSHRIGRFLIKFEQFDEEHPLWTEELLDGTPTFYCILGVSRNATKDEIQKAFEEKLKFSSYSKDVIKEAFEVLNDLKLQKEYDELLFIFEQMTKCMSHMEKSELIENHNANISIENEFVRMGCIQPQYEQFLSLHLFGAPDLYEMVGLNKKSSFEEIKSQCETGSELIKKIYTILGNPAKREEYDFMMYFIQKYGERSKHEQRKKRMITWINMDRNLFEKIMVNALDRSDDAEKLKRRMFEILTNNQDWQQYLPPNKETFFSILCLDKSSLSCDKKEIEKIIREKYRYLEKTPKVNLAYSVLKNESQRSDYLQLIENIELLNAYKKIFSDEEDEEMDIVSSKIARKGRMERSTKKEQYTQITFEDIEKAIENIWKSTHKG